MNVGRGLVNDDNLRDDITVDGKVNHSDTTLERSKLQSDDCTSLSALV